MADANSTGEQWSGRLGFTLATIGSAVGIGSIWKFPYEVGSNGGGAFVALYIAGLALIVVPLMLAEFAIGRQGAGDPLTSIAAVARAHGAGRAWAVIGALGVLTGFLILSFYAVIGGWTIGYAFDTMTQGLPGADAQAVHGRYESFLASPASMLGYQLLFLAIAAFVVVRGVGRGIEAAAKVLMPVLLVLLLLLAGYALIEGDVARTLRYLFVPEWDQVTARAALEALGLGFFSIGVGLGLMITYAAYSNAAISLREVAIVSVLADTAISLLAGLAVFPIVFGNQLDPASGPGLVFVTLPLAFARLPLGPLAAIAFFLLLFVAALASAISMLETVVATLVRRYGWTRRTACAVCSVTCFVAGVPTVLSFNLWSDWYPLAAVQGFGTATFFDLIDHLTSNVLLPIGGFALALFAGWAIPARFLREQLRLGERGTAALLVLLRYVAPAGIAAAALGGIFIARGGG
jgi:neurotransmitter:Na+ symporter, NSS family